MVRLLYGVSTIGLGHASRAVAVGKELTRLGAKIEFATGGNAVPFLESYDFKVHDVIDEPVPREKEGEMKDATLWYLAYWRGFRRSKKRMTALLADTRPDMVVGDEEFAGVSVALEKGTANALITDELGLGFARSPLARFVERRVASWYRELQSKVSALIIPDIGDDTGNRHYVSPIVRPVERSRQEVVHDFSLPSKGSMVLFSMSGSGSGVSFLKATITALEGVRSDGTFLVVSGNRGKKSSGEGIFDVGVVRDNQDLVAAADLVISTAGKSTMDEAASSGTPIIALPIRHHFEQESNASALGYRFQDASRLSELIPLSLGKRNGPKQFRGAARTAELLLEMAERRDK